MNLYYTLLFVLTKIVASQNPSPCPDTFTYEEGHTENDRWYGVISLRSNEDLSGVWLHVALDRPAELLGNWFGEATSSDNRDFTIRNAKYKLEAGPPVSIRFYVKYNAARTIPSLTDIRLNGKTICTTQKSENELGPTTPTLHISQPRRSQSGTNTNNQNSRPSTSDNSSGTPSSNAVNGGSTRNRPSSQPSSASDSGSTLTFTDDNESDDDQEFFPGDFAQLNSPTQSKPVSRPSQGSNRSSKCGVIASRATPFISNGQATAPGQWPWHVAIYHSKGIQLMYTCGGTLISEQHVLTAAHCVTRPRTNRAVNPGNILLYLGKYNLVTFEPDVQDRGVSDIFIHPDYNYTVFFNDVAILKLSKPAELTNFVRTCCLWDEDSDLENVIGKEGVVVGWGFDEKKKLSSKLMQAPMPIISTVKCIYSNRDFFSQFTFEKNFCAGFRNGTSVCNGDSGGGMVLPKKGTSGQNTIWQIRGLVSVGVALQGQGICDTSQYVVFTDVAKHTNWIRQVLAN